MIVVRQDAAPPEGRVMAMTVSLLSASVLSLFFTQRILAIRSWARLPIVVWLVFAIYADSYVFVFATAILQHALGVSLSIKTCDAAILLCLACYVTTKFVYLFLVEKAHIVRSTRKRRSRSKLYIFNSLGMLGVYAAVVILNFVFRIARFQDGQCIIGMKSLAMIPLISFDAVVNVYLTMLFLIPLRNLYSYRNMPHSPANTRLRTVAFRTFCGSVCALLSSITNLSVLVSLDGEPGWICLMSCNCDVLFSAIVIQWVTSKDNAGTRSSSPLNICLDQRGRHLGPGSCLGSLAPSTPDSSLATAQECAQGNLYFQGRAKGQDAREAEEGRVVNLAGEHEM
ncbi:uncharacterized protein UV8b_08062 [Ustilaginoidea virens]|uniref:Uncharacterized protein n=1 Tax=Ustilaginoidea virens TaxID=1159556 RepID=A0A8E5ML61_USTVR|nr:uncharacterized protein UV8b_08062 [Ustilaginoidea virens]QUC23821.1 hypothetical protein UV8b_08062 [Ustilaginoidea virens]